MDDLVSAQVLTGTYYKGALSTACVLADITPSQASQPTLPIRLLIRIPRYLHIFNAECVSFREFDKFFQRETDNHGFQYDTTTDNLNYEMIIQSS